ncbi:hypothetical protein Ancab_029916 [Ancistrocladus abbreviatus]
MEFSEDWKSLWPISSVLTPPLLLRQPSTSSSPSSALLGPLFFNPIPDTVTTLLASPSLSPPILAPPPSVSLPRFLQTTTAPFSPILPSASSAIASEFSADPTRDCSAYNHNRLELLLCPNNRILAFFPTGENLDRVGSLVLSCRDSCSRVCLDGGGDVMMSMVKFNHRILQLSASRVDFSSSFSGAEGYCVFGFLMARTMYSVHWFRVGIRGLDSNSDKPVLVYLGGKLFKSCSVVHACWNPHLPEESLVLLESGELFLFDMNSPSLSSSAAASRLYSLNARFIGKKVTALRDQADECPQNGWFSCEFSWHPRTLVVANANAVFLVDFRFEKAGVSCLLKTELLGYNSVVENTSQFVAFSKAGPDGFYFTVASESLLVLCDVRKPLIPVLQWVQYLRQPRYMTVLPISKLRSNSSDDTHKWASETGFGIILGSFWSGDFSLFCYGPPTPAPPGSLASKISQFCNSFYAWEMPSELSLSGRHCLCGSCLFRMDFAKDDLPEWIEWQQKKEMVLGFFILDKDLSSLSSKSEVHGGFTLVRLMSSGKLEAQRYRASPNMVRINKAAHGKLPLNLKDSLLYSMGNEEYKFRRKFQYLKLDYLYSYLNGILAEVLVSKSKKPIRVASGKETSVHFHEFLCEKLKVLGFVVPISSLSVADIFRDVSMPTSMYEVASRSMWTMLPMDILELAFSNYTECLAVLVDSKKMSFDFLAVPDQTQLPPFFLRNQSCRSNKWSSKVRRGNDFIGPVLPLPACLVLGEIRKKDNNNLKKVNEFSPELELALQCEAVMQAAQEISGNHDLHNEFAVPLGDDREDTWVSSQSSNSFFLYEPNAFLGELHGVNALDEDPINEDKRFSMTIAKLPDERPKGPIDPVGMELFNDLCPVVLRFDNHNVNFEPNELTAYKLLKRQFSRWQDGFAPYQDFCMRIGNQKQDQVFGVNLAR